MISATDGGDGRSGARVAVLLRGPEGPQAVGQPIPLRVMVRNEGPDEIWMVGVLDGSEESARLPQYRPTIFREREIVAAPPPPEDPMVAALRIDDFTRLGPGESFDPTEGGGKAAYVRLMTFDNFRSSQPGTYHFVLELSTEDGDDDRWLGIVGRDADPSRLLELLKGVPRVTVSSNRLAVEVR